MSFFINFTNWTRGYEPILYRTCLSDDFNDYDKVMFITQREWCLQTVTLCIGKCVITFASLMVPFNVQSVSNKPLVIQLQNRICMIYIEYSWVCVYIYRFTGTNLVEFCYIPKLCILLWGIIKRHLKFRNPGCPLHKLIIINVILNSRSQWNVGKANIVLHGNS